ncbi:VOC family protein [Cellulomonas rhizosphaerae]|uniref:VOC family protein n=1 Tax=Cellulomonas rhizosphaerae TaxID=2293719 RepID=A0A413RHS8_9CELL|nr:VOC family protein [Cellulomonas rhizosphaerae]RHA37764.1 VOC family protein [Cellulomonas rhizosphaerae]
MNTFRGLANTSLFADDVPAAQRWYADFLDLEPYFVRDGYVEFRLGDHDDELGIVDRRYAPNQGGPSGAIVYWHVDELEATFERALALGATQHDEVRERGAGFVTASVVDPFGNVLGLMTNPNWLAHA